MRAVLFCRGRIICAPISRRLRTVSYTHLYVYKRQDYEALKKKKEEEEAERQREKKMQQALLSIKKKYGKNAILKGMNLEEGATAVERNKPVSYTHLDVYKRQHLHRFLI